VAGLAGSGDVGPPALNIAPLITEGNAQPVLVWVRQGCWPRDALWRVPTHRAYQAEPSRSAKLQAPRLCCQDDLSGSCPRLRCRSRGRLRAGALSSWRARDIGLPDDCRRLGGPLAPTSRPKPCHCANCLLRNRDPLSPKRHGKEVALVMPMRGPSTTVGRGRSCGTPSSEKGATSRRMPS